MNNKYAFCQDDDAYARNGRYAIGIADGISAMIHTRLFITRRCCAALARLLLPTIAPYIVASPATACRQMLRRHFATMPAALRYDAVTSATRAHVTQLPYYCRIADIRHVIVGQQLEDYAILLLAIFDY